MRKRCRYLISCAALTSMLLTGVVVETPVADANTSLVSVPPTLTVDQQVSETGIPEVRNEETNWPKIVSKAAVVMDLSTGTVVYQKSPLAPHYPASITKILTAKIALDKGQLTDKLTTSKNAASQQGNRVYLVPGEVEPLEQLLYGLLLNSGNDAAVTIAEHYGGSVKNFANMMNEEAKALGATHSHFANPNGLPNKKHVTTAYDMAVITRAAMQDPEFRKIVSTKQYAWHGKAWDSTLINENHMLFNYPGAMGVKTGFTTVAHETLVVAAKRGNTSFVAVLMDAPMSLQIRNDATKLLNYAFAHYATQELVHQGQVVGTFTTPQGTPVPLRSAQTVLATEPKGQTLTVQQTVNAVPLYRDTPANAVGGFLQLQASGRDLRSVPLLLNAAVAVPEVPYENTPWLLTHWWLVSGAAVMLIVGILVVRRYRRRSSRRGSALPKAGQVRPNWAYHPDERLEHPKIPK